MAVPRQVQEQAERADQMIAQMQNPTQPPPTDGQATPPQEATASTPPADPPAPQPQHEVPPQPKDERNDWKAKYLVLKGKYDSEVPRLAHENRELRGEVIQLRDEMAAIKSNPAPATPAANTEDTLDMLDPELRSGIQTMLKSGIEAATNPLEQQLAEFNRSEHERRWASFVSAVRSEVDDYEAIDASEDFQTWVSDMDSFSGRSRGELLDEAIKSMAAGRVIAIYRAFKADKGASAPPPPPQGVVQPQPLQDRVVPAPSGSSAPPPAQPTMIRREEVSKFYADVTKGLYRGRETEAKQKQAEIEQAYREGRVI